MFSILFQWTPMIGCNTCKSLTKMTDNLPKTFLKKERNNERNRKSVEEGRMNKTIGTKSQAVIHCSTQKTLKIEPRTPIPTKHRE